MRPALYAGTTGYPPHPRPAPQPRGPLPPFDARADLGNPSLQLHTTLPPGFALPPTAMRGNFWGVEVPGGLPFIPGGTSSVKPNRCLDWFIDEYVARDRTSFDRSLTAKAQHGLNTFLLSRGGGFGRQAVAAQADQAAYIRSWGFDVLFMLTSKDIDTPFGHPGQAAENFARVQPYLDALLAVNALQRVSLAWEANAFWDPVELDAFKHVVRNYLPRTVRTGCHFTTYGTAWQINGQPRAAFWADGTLDDLYYQTHPSAPLRTNQAHLNDAMVPASGLQANGITLNLMEVDAAAQFDGSFTGSVDGHQYAWTSDEDLGDMRAFGLLCTPGPIMVDGLGNGGHRRPDGGYL